MIDLAGLLNPLDSPHHMRVDDQSPYREGVVLNRPTKPGWGSLVNCGMRKEVKIDRSLNPGIRVTVRIDNAQPGGEAAITYSMTEAFCQGNGGFCSIFCNLSCLSSMCYC